MGERLSSGLQIRLHQFESGPGLHYQLTINILLGFVFNSSYPLVWARAMYTKLFIFGVYQKFIRYKCVVDDWAQMKTKHTLLGMVFIQLLSLIHI